MRFRIAILALLAGLFLMGQIYNIQFAPRGGTDFTASAGTGASCLGAWLIFNDDTEATSALDRCTNAVNQNGVDDMTWAGSNWATATAPTGTAANYDAVEITADTAEWFSLADDDAFTADEFTAGCWIRPDVGDPGATVIGKEDITAWEMYWADTDDNLYVEVTNLAESTAANSVPAGEWHWVAIRYDPDTDQSEAFIDGLLACSGACQAAVNPPGENAHPLRIGANQLGDVSGEFDGGIMECFYFDTALTNTEIAEIFLCGLRGDADGWARDAAYGGAQCSAISTCCS